MFSKLKSNLTSILDDESIKTLCVAVSGGIDSMALVFLMKELMEETDLCHCEERSDAETLSLRGARSATRKHCHCEEHEVRRGNLPSCHCEERSDAAIHKSSHNDKNIKIIAVTVDHGLRKNSAKEAKLVGEILKKNKIEHHILKWEGKKPVKNIEAVAREKRYELLTEFCKKKKIKHLLVAHHLQDQAETFFIRLFRGSGIDGLSAMKKVVEYNGVKIVRPLLNVLKKDLEKYLKKKNIPWVEDESNEDEKFLRNKIRKFLNSFEDKPVILKRIDSAINEIAKARDIIEKKTEIVKKKVLKFDNRGVCVIQLHEFLELEKDSGLRILADALMKVSGNCYKPRLEKLERVYNSICHCEEFLSCHCEEHKVRRGNLPSCHCEERSDAETLSLRAFLRNARQSPATHCVIASSTKCDAAIHKSSQQKNLKTTFYGCVLEQLNNNELIIYREYAAIGEDKKLEYNKKILWDSRFFVELKQKKSTLIVSHIKKGEFNSLLKSLKNTDMAKYKELKNLKGIDKKIFYTLPVVMEIVK